MKKLITIQITPTTEELLKKINKNLFSNMLCNTLNINPEKGKLTGKCCICKKETKTGFKKKFSGNFTSGNYISNGNIVCPECNYLIKNSNTYRRTMFLLTEKELIKFKKKEALNIIFNLPKKPFYIYLTETYQKIGWIRLNEAYNHDNEGIINFLCDYDIIQADIETIKYINHFIKKLRDLKIPKKTLKTGELELYHYRKIVNEYDNHRELLKELKSYINNPIYELILYLED